MAMATSAVFKIPQEPRPLPSLESDEESFVVLGQSIPDVSTEVYPEPVGLSVIAEAKRLINSELEAIDQTKNNEEKKASLNDANRDVAKLSLSRMETSGHFPAMPNVDKGLESSNTISIASFSPDMSSEEVQNKIAQIMDENVRLKDTVLQNNMSLKSQYERIVAWQEDVQKVHQAHKEKLLDAKAFIETLKREKEALKRDLTKAAEVKNKQEAKIEELEKLLEEKNGQRSEDNIKESQLTDQAKKISDLEAQLKNMLIDKTREERDQQVARKLETELIQVNEQLSNANKKIEELKNEITNKTQREESLIMDINSFKTRIEENNNNSEEIMNLRTQLAETQNSLTKMEVTRTQAYSNVRQLTDELSDVKKQLESLQRQTQERSRDDDNDQEELFLLRTQLDVYKTDFEEERRAREIIKGEKDRLEEDLQNIQRRNQQLQEEIELIRRGEGDFVVYPRSSRTSSAREASAPTPSSKPLLLCPKCNFAFTELSNLERHIHRCLDLDDPV